MEQNPIACEACRVKKCKCDRTLPICSQCTSSETTCQYPQSSKRGIPTGFISSLERRLVETEAALFETLSFINTHFHPNDFPREENPLRDAFLRRGHGQSRDVKVEEWKRLPLTSAEHRRAWMSEKLEGTVGEDRGNSGVGCVPQAAENSWTSSPKPEIFAQGNGQSAPSPNDHSNIADGYQTSMSHTSIAESGHAGLQGASGLIDDLTDPDSWTRSGIPDEVVERARVSNDGANSSMDLDGMVVEQLSDDHNNTGMQMYNAQDILGRQNGPPIRTQVRSGSVSSFTTRRELSLKDRQRYF